MNIQTQNRVSRIIGRAARYVLLIAAVGITLIPIYWLLTISLKTETDMFTARPVWFSFTPTGEHFRETFGQKSFGAYLITSALVAVTSTAVALIIGTLAAYALAQFRLSKRLTERLSFWIISSRMLPPIVTLVPLFLLIRDAGLLDTMLALIIVYAGFNLPFVVWMMRGFFEELPREIE